MSARDFMRTLPIEHGMEINEIARVILDSVESGDARDFALRETTMRPDAFEALMRRYARGELLWYDMRFYHTHGRFPWEELSQDVIGLEHN